MSSPAQTAPPLRYCQPLLLTMRRSTHCYPAATGTPGRQRLRSGGHCPRWGCTATAGTAFDSSTWRSGARVGRRQRTWCGRSPLRICTTQTRSRQRVPWSSGRARSVTGTAISPCRSGTDAWCRPLADRCRSCRFAASPTMPTWGGCPRTSTCEITPAGDRRGWVVRRQGLEPRTRWLRASCSAN